MPVNSRAAKTRTNVKGPGLIWAPKSFALRSAIFFGLLSFAFYARLLFNSGHNVWSKYDNDLVTAVIPWWTFGYGEMLHGNFPLWNPHNFCGTPFFSNFNPGMLYPVHVLCLLLPLDNALNLILVIHVALSGWFTSLWCRNRDVSPLGSVVAGVIFMFSGAYFHHTYPGHESPLAAISLTPLIFLCVDAIDNQAAWQWVLLGMLAVALQCLAGFPQAVYYTALLATLYVGLRMVFYEDRLLILRRFFLIYAGGAMLASVQLLPGLQTAGESVRQGGNNFQFAATCPLPPANLVHFLAPAVLGDGENSPYVGTWYPWEVSIFCGISTLLLAGCGAVLGDRTSRRFATTLAIVSLVLALGVNVKPVFWALYHAIPLFKSFRCVARFNWFLTLYIAMLAGIGFDVLVGTRPWKWWPATTAIAGAAGLGAMAIGCAISANAGTNGIWGRFVLWLAASPDQIFGHNSVTDQVASLTGHFAAWQFCHSAITLLCMAAALLSMRWWRFGAYLLAGVTIAEMVFFANTLFVTTPMYLPYPSNWTAARYGDPAGYRYLHPGLEYPNTAMIGNFDDLYGYDPVTLKRYADLIAISQDVDPDRMNFVTQFSKARYLGILQMLRCHYAFYLDQQTAADGSPVRVPQIVQFPNPMQELQLVSQYQLAPSRDEVTAALHQPTFDPRQVVVLESKPEPAPSPASAGTSPGSAEVTDRSTDWLEIKAHLTQPAILLVTDAYSSAWRVRPLDPDPPQSAYNVMPANYALRAIPLAAGEHRFVLEYAPAGYRIGKWVSIISLLAWLMLAFRCWRGHTDSEQRPPDQLAAAASRVVPAT
jgi:hypothetical protein